MWNTSFLLPGVLLSPVTLLAGPQVSLTVALTLGFAGSAASLFWVLRRWGASLGAAALGGAVYGFSPALVTAGLGHYHLQFAVLPPLIIDAVAAAGHRSRARRAGPALWLGLLCAAQLFIGEELLVYTAVASLILVVALALSRPGEVPRRAREALRRAGRRGGGVPARSTGTRCGCSSRPAGRAQQAPASLTGNLSWFVDAVGFAAVPHPGQRGRRRRDPAAARRVPGLPGLAADRRPGGRRGGVLAGSPGPGRGGDSGRCWSCARSAAATCASAALQVAGAAAAVALARRACPGWPRCCRGGSPSSPTARPPRCSCSRWTGRWRRCRAPRTQRQAGLARLAGALGPRRARRGRGARRPAAGPAALPGDPGRAGPGRLAGGLQRAAAPAGRAGARRAVPLRRPVASAALAGGYRPARRDDRRLLHRAQPRPGRPRSSSRPTASRAMSPGT